MTTKAPPTMSQAPESLAAAFAVAGLDVSLAVTRKDGEPLDENDKEAVLALVACHDLEVGREVTDDEAAKAALSPGLKPLEGILLLGTPRGERGEVPPAKKMMAG